MSIDAPKPRPAPEIDYADETLADTNYVFIPQPELRALAESQDDVASPQLEDALVSELLKTGK